MRFHGENLKGLVSLPLFLGRYGEVNKVELSCSVKKRNVGF